MGWTAATAFSDYSVDAMLHKKELNLFLKFLNVHYVFVSRNNYFLRVALIGSCIPQKMIINFPDAIFAELCLLATFPDC